MKNDKDSVAKVTVRVPADLHETMVRAAKYNGRSLQAEMIARFQAAIVDDQMSKLTREVAEVKALVRELLDR